VIGPSATGQRVSGIRSGVLRILSACPSDSTTSSLTLTIFPLWPGWTQALDWKVLPERENEIVIGTDENALVGMCFMPVTDPKTVKNRVHLDLTSSTADRDQEIDRLLALGGRRVDVGQTGAESWTVLADPQDS
jgi:Glyoxalase-like domain